MENSAPRTSWNNTEFSVDDPAQLDEPLDDYPNIDQVVMELLNGSLKKKSGNGAVSSSGANASENKPLNGSDANIEDLPYDFIAPFVLNSMPFGLNGVNMEAAPPPEESPEKILRQTNERAKTTTRSSIDPPAPKPFVGPKRRMRKSATTPPTSNVKEGMEGNEMFEGENEMRHLSDLIGKCVSSPTPEVIGAAAQAIAMSIPHFFYIMQAVSIILVNIFYSKDMKDDEYKEDVKLVEYQLNRYITTVLGFSVAFNLWYLLFYTDHYIDFVPLVEAKLFNPVSWIIGPAMTPVVLLNYYFLGKRLEESFHAKYIQPMLERKWLSMTLFFIGVSLLYPTFNSYMANTVSDLAQGKPNTLYGIVLGIGCLTYLYKIVFNIKTLSSVQYILQSILLVIIIFVIVGVFVAIAAKGSLLFIIAYLMFYSFVPLVAFTIASGSDPITQILRMINDSRESCGPVNLSGGLFSYAQTMAKRNLFVIFIGVIYFSLVINSLFELDKLNHQGLKHMTKALYSSFILIPGLIGIASYFGPSKIIKVAIGAPPVDPEAPDEPAISIFKQLMVLGVLFIVAIIAIPFLLLGAPFMMLTSIFKLMNWDSFAGITEWIQYGLLFPLTFLWKRLKLFFIPKQYQSDEPNTTSTDNGIDSNGSETDVSNQFTP